MKVHVLRAAKEKLKESSKKEVKEIVTDIFCIKVKVKCLMSTLEKRLDTKKLPFDTWYSGP